MVKEKAKSREEKRKKAKTKTYLQIRSIRIQQSRYSNFVGRVSPDSGCSRSNGTHSSRCAKLHIYEFSLIAIKFENGGIFRIKAPNRFESKSDQSNISKTIDQPFGCFPEIFEVRKTRVQRSNPGTVVVCFIEFLFFFVCHPRH